MNELNQNKSFVAYEYLSIDVKKDKATLYSDCYKNFGWIPENQEDSLKGIGSIVLKFKRNRKIENRTELCQQQKQCENTLSVISRLEQSKTCLATGISIGLGFVGISLITGSVFSYLASLIAPFIILGVLGFVASGFPYLIYKELKKQKTAKVNPLIDKEYELLYKTCEQANSLIQ